MGPGEHLGSNQRYLVHRESLLVRIGNKLGNKPDHRTIATSLVYPLRTNSLPRSVPDLPSYGSGLELSY